MDQKPQELVVKLYFDNLKLNQKAKVVHKALAKEMEAQWTIIESTQTILDGLADLIIELRGRGFIE